MRKYFFNQIKQHSIYWLWGTFSTSVAMYQTLKLKKNEDWLHREYRRFDVANRLRHEPISKTKERADGLLKNGDCGRLANRVLYHQRFFFSSDAEKSQVYSDAYDECIREIKSEFSDYEYFYPYGLNCGYPYE